MPTIRVDKFQGLAPRFDRRQIPVGAAQIALDLRFDAGDLKPFLTLHNPGLPNLGVTGANIGNLFYFENDGVGRFISFGDAMHVTAARSPVPNDQFVRWYWNIRGGPDSQGMFAISLADQSLPAPNGSPTGAGSNYRDFAGYRAGIPAPQEKPEAAADEVAQPAVGDGTDKAIVSISLTNPATVNLDSEPPFTSGQRVRLRVNPAYPRPGEDDGGDGPPPEDPQPEPGDGDGQVWSLDGLEAVVSNVGPSSFDLTGINLGGFSEFTENDLEALNIQRILVDQDLESRAYVWTYVSEFDEEGPPSPASNVIDVEKDGQARIQIGDTAYSLANGGTRDNVNRIRIYRTVAGETATLYVLVGTLPFSGGASDDSDVRWAEGDGSPPTPGSGPPTTSNPALAWSATVVDPVPSVDLGEPLPSEGWFPPPTDLWGILQLPNGVMAGWKGSTVYFSEPYLPHAWDPDNTLTLTEDVVGAQSFGATMVVGTIGRPYIIQGMDPASMRAQKLPDHAPLLNPRAIADAGVGVIYAADNGLVLVGPGGARILTRKWSKETWLPVAQARGRLEFFDGYAILYGPNQTPLILSMVGEDAEASLSANNFSAMTRRRNSLAVVTQQPVTGQPFRLVRYFNEGSQRTLATFRSGLVTFRRPCNAAVGQVLADGYPLTLTVRAIRPPSYPEPPAGQPDLETLNTMTYTVDGPEPFRLVAGYVSREYEIQIQSQHRVQSVVLATSMDEVRQQP